MGLVQRIAARKHLRVLRNADLEAPDELAEARRRIAEAGASVLPALLDMVAEGIENGPFEETLVSLIDDATLGRAVGALQGLQGGPADLLERVLSQASGYDPLPLFDALETAGGSRPRIERILRVRGKHLRWEVIRSLLEGASRDRIRVVLGVLESRSEPQAAQVLLPLLTSGDPWARIQVLRFLGARQAAEAGDAIVARLDDRDPGVRREAVQALGAIRSSAYLAPLCERLRDSDLQVSSAAIAALVAIGDPGAVRHLIAVLKDESEYARRGAVEVLNEVATTEAIQDLVQALQDEDWWVRVRAADALGALGGERVVDAILTLVGSEDVFVRRYAIEILNSIPSGRSVPALIGALADTDWWVRERAIDALGKTGDPRAVGPLKQELRLEPRLAHLVLAALARIGEATALEAIVGFLVGPDAEVRQAAGKTLRELAKTAADVEIRKGAARALSDKGDASEWGRAQGGEGSGGSAPAAGGGQKSGFFQAVDASRMQARLPEMGLAPPTGVGPRPAGLEPGESGPPTPSAGGATAVTSGGMAAGSEIPGGRAGVGSAAPEDSGRDIARTQRVNFDSGLRTPSGVSAHGGGLGGGVSLFDYPSLPAGTVLLDRYTVLRKIGEGGFGYVYLVLDGSVREELILKILSPQISLDDTMIQRFVHELKYNRRIVHPNVIRLYDFLELNPGHAISMEYFPSIDLGTLLDRERTVAGDRLVRITEQICHGLKAAHDSGIVHRDIKPPNVLLGDEDRVKIVDFGLAAASDTKHSRVTKSGILVGTPQYMAPEQIRGSEIDLRTDIYSLGALLFECLSGRPPFASENPVNVLMMHLTEPVPEIRAVCPDAPEPLIWLIDRSLAKDPADRPQSVDEILAELRRRAA